MNDDGYETPIIVARDWIDSINAGQGALTYPFARGRANSTYKET